MSTSNLLNKEEPATAAAAVSLTKWDFNDGGIKRVIAPMKCKNPTLFRNQDPVYIIITS